MISYQHCFNLPVSVQMPMDASKMSASTTSCLTFSLLLLAVVGVVAGGGGVELLPCGANTTLTEPGLPLGLESLNWGRGEFYPNSHQCEWSLAVPPHRVGLLQCPHFSLTPFLCLDTLTITNEGQGHNALTYCGSQGPVSLRLRGATSIRFSTSAFFPGRGFSCTFSLLPLEEEEEEEREGEDAEGDSDTGCACGINNLGTKIVNGTETKAGEVPWQAGIVRTGENVPFCGGSLINGN